MSDLSSAGHTGLMVGPPGRRITEHHSDRGTRERSPFRYARTLELTDDLRGERDVSDVDHNVVVRALNEFLLERGDNHSLATDESDCSTSIRSLIL